MKISLYLVVLFFFISCSEKDHPITYGVDDCTFCKMKIMDRKFGAEVITKKGKTYKFDSFECMINYLKKNESLQPSVFQYLVVDYSNPGNLIDAKSAFWVYSENVNSPMGGNVAAFTSVKFATEFEQHSKGSLITWKDVQKKITDTILVE